MSPLPPPPPPPPPPPELDELHPASATRSEAARYFMRGSIPYGSPDAATGDTLLSRVFAQDHSGRVGRGDVPAHRGVALAVPPRPDQVAVGAGAPLRRDLGVEQHRALIVRVRIVGHRRVDPGLADDERLAERGRVHEV